MGRPVVILGAWGSGSSALTGLFDRLGYHSCPPHFSTNDPRTPNSFEPERLREIILQRFDEHSLARRTLPSEKLVEELAAWIEQEKTLCGKRGKTAPVLKLPHLCFFVPELTEACDPRYLMITRPFAEIERTRQRRNWPANLGAKGALACYQRAVSDLIMLKRDFLAIAFAGLRAHPERTLQDTLSYLGAPLEPDAIQSAARWIFKT